MPVDFEDSDISEVIEQVQGTENPEIDDQQMYDEVEKRLERAHYYRLLLQNSFFEDAPNAEIAEMVTAEIRDFARERMAALIGLGDSEPKKTKLPFTDEEVTALRILANPEILGTLKVLVAKLTKKPELLDFKPAPLPAEAPKKKAQEPTLKKVAFKPRGRPPTNPQPVAPKTPGMVGKQKKLERVVVMPDGREVKQNLTPQAQPTVAKPAPTPRGKQAIEATMAAAAGVHSQAALRSLENKLRGKTPDINVDMQQTGNM